MPEARLHPGLPSGLTTSRTWGMGWPGGLTSPGTRVVCQRLGCASGMPGFALARSLVWGMPALCRDSLSLVVSFGVCQRYAAIHSRSLLWGMPAVCRAGHKRTAHLVTIIRAEHFNVCRTALLTPNTLDQPYVRAERSSCRTTRLTQPFLFERLWRGGGGRLVKTFETGLRRDSDTS